jgi:hypothetical protein
MFFKYLRSLPTYVSFVNLDNYCEIIYLVFNSVIGTYTFSYACCLVHNVTIVP